MSYKKLFFPIGGGAELEERINAALMISKHFNAHIDILKANAKPSSIMKFDRSLSDSLLADLNALAERRMKDDANKHKDIFEEMASKNDVKVTKKFSDDYTSANMITKDGYRSELIEKYSKFCDLVIISSPSKGNITATFEATVSKSGKPALMFPRKMKKFSTKKIIIGWNNSLEVSRAISNAMPILKEAKEVHIVSAKEFIKDKKDLNRLQNYLLHHGVKSSVEIVKTTKVPGEALLREAQNGNFDMIVAGAFGQKGFKELFMGGTTKYVLEHTDIPVFMSN